MPNFPYPYLLALTERLLQALGTPGDIAAIVARSLVGANLTGHDSHGLLRLPQYVPGIRAGAIQPEARAVTTPATAMLATLAVDGAWGWGPPAAHLAAAHVVERAREYGIGAAVVQRCNHIGRVGQYVERIAEHNLIGIVCCNSAPGVAPFGGFKRTLGTNPIAIAVPRAMGRPPVLLDGSTSAVAEGKLRIALDKGEQVPSGWLIDRDGRPSTNPSDFYVGGALLSMGGHKGYALGVMVELIGGLLSGMSAAFLPNFGKGNGVFVMAFRPDAFVPLDVYLEQVERVCTALKVSPGAHDGSEILIPGEPEQRSMRERLANGIPLAPATWAALSALAGELGVDT